MSVCMHACIHMCVQYTYNIYTYIVYMCMHTSVPVCVWVCVCVSVCTCIYIYIYICMCVYVYIYTYVYIYAWVCVYVCVCLHACVHACVCLYLHAYACVHACVCMYVGACTFDYAHTVSWNHRSNFSTSLMGKSFSLVWKEHEIVRCCLRRGWKQNFCLFFEEESIMYPVMCLRLTSLWSQDSLEWFVCLMSAGTLGVPYHAS